MIFKTLNSTYEVDEVFHQIRRIEGVNAPTPRQGKDGEWREYHTLLLLANGSYLIQWNNPPEGEPARCTITSTVVDA